MKFYNAVLITFTICLNCMCWNQHNPSFVFPAHSYLLQDQLLLLHFHHHVAVQVSGKQSRLVRCFFSPSFSLPRIANHQNCFYVSNFPYPYLHTFSSHRESSPQKPCLSSSILHQDCSIGSIT